MAFWTRLYSAPEPPTRTSLTLFFLLAGAFLLTLVPHLPQFPVWVSVVVVVAMIIRSVIAYYRLPLPSSTFCGIMAILLLGAIWVQFRTVLGRDAGTALTAGLLAIKFFEIRRPRDISLIIFSCFFVVMSALLYSQVLELFIYCLIMMWVLTALLLRIHTGDTPQDRLLRMLSKSGLIFLQALPLMLFLYLFCPRYTGKLGLPLDQASIGLTDTVAPGSIARLSQNDTPAMYVSFPSDDGPTISSMYWRALVLWDYKNGTWTQGELSSVPSRRRLSTLKDSEVRQEITVFRHNQRWLFALDAPVAAPINKAEPLNWATEFNGDTISLTSNTTNTKLDHNARYDVTSSPIRPQEDLTDSEYSAATRLPLDSDKDRIDPRVVTLANQLHQGLAEGQTREYINAVLHYFRHGGFFYSASPGEQGPDWLPVFLFQSRKGFCEHFASSFAVLMRLEKIPARLVVGYQGADYNPYADHYTVLQSNAHAWDEVWTPEAKSSANGSRPHRGHWERWDPTALLTASEDATAAADANGGDNGSIRVAQRQASFAEQYLPAWMRDGVKEIQLRREEVEAEWDNLVFSYDPETQSRLALALGLGQNANPRLILICLIAVALCGAILFLWIRRKPPVPPMEKLYASFCRRMAHRGVPRAIWEGPLAYTGRVAETFPDEKPAIQRVGSLIATARYGRAPVDPHLPQQLKETLAVLSASQAAVSSREPR